MIKPHFYTSVLISLSLYLVLFSGCRAKEKVSMEVIPEHLLREGDLVFRRGLGLASHVVLAADQKGMYSHVGMVIFHEGSWQVVHAVPGEPDFDGDPDRVKLESIQQYFSPTRASAGAIMRPSYDSIDCLRAARQALTFYEAGFLFDHTYDLNDTTRVYCTELIQRSYLREGMDLAEGRTTPVQIPTMNGTYLLPGDISSNENIELIYQF